MLEYGHQMDGEQLHARLCAHPEISLEPNRPLHNALLPAVSSAPFGESGRRPKKMAVAESKSTLDLLPEDLLLLCFGERKLTQRSKRSFETQDPVLVI